MPNFNIHWKGYPHHRLPRIHVVSDRPHPIQNRSISSLGQSTTVRLQTLREKENKKLPFGIQFRRRRVRGSRTSSSIARARKRAALRARQDIQVFGWTTPRAELASRATNERPRSGYLTRTKSGRIVRVHLEEDSVIPSTDGAASSVARGYKAPKKKSERDYSLRHIAKVPVYWTVDHAPKQQSVNPDRLYSARHSVPLQDASNRVSTRPSRSRTLGARTDIRSSTGIDRSISSTGPQFKHQTFRRPTSQISPGRKDTGVGSHEFWQAVRKHKQKPDSRSISVLSTKSIVQTILSNPASRTSSQKRVLDRFTKGIELYLQAAKTFPRVSLVTSPSISTISAHTIHDLIPYRSEFQSAGLAVTSAEQMGLAILRESLLPPPSPSKDEGYEMERFSRSKGKAPQDNRNSSKLQKGKQPSYASGSTGTTILGFTPPHEKPYARPKAETRRSSLSSDHTIIGFTLPNGTKAPPNRPPPSPPQPVSRPAKKKSLPWLRKSDGSPQPSPAKKVSVINPQAGQHRPSTPLTGWISAVESPDQPISSKKPERREAREDSTYTPSHSDVY